MSPSESIESLNDCFELLKIKLIEYLKTIDCKKINYGIQNLLNLNSLSNKEIKEPRTFLIINFNYTNTIEKYLNFEWPEDGIGLKYELLHIHGKVSEEKKYPIIFGYGDETDKYFSLLEELDNHQFVKYFKSDGYGLSPNYRIVSKFIDTTEYEVHVLGHSCGSSDRVLLKAIFDNPRCMEIKIFHHKREDFTTDFIEIYRNISRCFSVDNRHAFKGKTINYIERNHLPQY